jgi:spore maturation protein CgeB
MAKAKRIFFVSDTKDFTDKFLLADLRKRIKGFIRLGHDTQVFNYNSAFSRISLVKGQKLSALLYKYKVDELLVRQIKNYNPDIINIDFAKFLDAETIVRMRQANSGAFFIGWDVDLWPELHKNRIEAAAQLDMVLTTYDGLGQQTLKNAGARCVFMPNICDPDIEHRYDVSDEWKTGILFTGKLEHKHYPTDDIRYELLERLYKMKNCSLYGCFGHPLIHGMQYLYAISGARIGLSINAANDIRLYHSDRFYHYLACGTFVLAKRVPDTDLLFQDKVHLRYFDTVEEFFDLANWYLTHQDERIKIANAGMEHAHAEFNCQKMAKYILDIIETGRYSAPWMR